MHLAEEFGYLAIVLDAFSRKVVGCALETHLRAALAIAALDMAIAARRPICGSLIHHSDRGGQYACGDYTKILRDNDIQPSMSRVGNPYDNAKAESFMKTLKQEEVDGSAYRDVADARARIGCFIEAVYNRQRLHSALDYLSPEEYEANAPRPVPDSLVSLKGCTPVPLDRADGFQGFSLVIVVIAARPDRLGESSDRRLGRAQHRFRP